MLHDIVKYPTQRVPVNLDQIAESGAMPEEMSNFLKVVAQAHLTIVFAGGAGEGKTTLLESYSHHFHPEDSIIVIEETKEIEVSPAQRIIYWGNPLDSKTISHLIRMHPDLIVCGELTGEMTHSVLSAANRGVPAATTIQAHDADDAVLRIADMAVEGGSNDISEALTLVSDSVRVLVTVERSPEDGEHRVSGIYDVPASPSASDDGLAVLSPVPLWERDGAYGQWIKINEPSAQLLKELAFGKKYARGGAIHSSIHGSTPFEDLPHPYTAPRSIL